MQGDVYRYCLSFQNVADSGNGPTPNQRASNGRGTRRPRMGLPVLVIGRIRGGGDQRPATGRGLWTDPRAPLCVLHRLPGCSGGCDRRHLSPDLISGASGPGRLSRQKIERSGERSFFLLDLPTRPTICAAAAWLPERSLAVALCAGGYSRAAAAIDPSLQPSLQPACCVRSQIRRTCAPLGTA